MPGTGSDIAWQRRRARRRGHRLAFVFAAAVLVSACTSSGTDQSSTPATTTPAVAAADLINRAVGGTQTVQDFTIHLDMAKQTANGPVSFYQEVIDHAATGQGDPVDLAGGFIFAPTTSIEGREVDSEGDQLPSLSVDFALLAATPELLGTTQAELIDTLRSGGSAEVADSLMGADPTGTQMLVEIVTANFAQRRTHVGPGDRSLVDITFTSVQPGDKLTSVYLFGQTLPGDPSAEEGMSTYELFTYRWNLGLVSFLAGDGGISTVIDESVDALKGSTIMSRETKKAILAAARYRAALNGAKMADDEFTAAREDSEGTYPADEDTVALYIQGRLVYMSKDRFIMYVANYTAAAACEALAAGMNKRNAEAGSPVTDTPSPEAGVDGATTTTSKPGPGPMSCEPNPPRYQDTKLFLGAPAPAAIYGDVHVLTFDGKTYANQAAGEFALFDNGVATMQLRTEPFENSDTVSVATALAARVDGHRVSIHASGDTYIDDALTHLTRGEPRPIGDGALLWSPTGWVLAWPDGTAAAITPHDGYLTILITPSVNPSSGMLGNADGDPSNDLVTRTGAILEASATRFDSFYPEYVDTWRITNDESLFHYEAGEDTTTFTIAGFPAAESNVESLREAAREAARDICRQAGITREDVMADCILDVAVTGNESFAYAAFLAGASTPEPEEPPTDGSAGPTETGPDTLTVGDLVLEFGPNPPVRGPNGFQPQWTCSVIDGSFYATSRYMQAPEREIKITIEYRDAETSGTGVARLALLVELNAQPYVWMLTFVEPAPGTIDALSLEGPTLDASGTAFLNDPIDPNLSPFALLPDGSTFQPFQLTATCDQ